MGLSVSVQIDAAVKAATAATQAAIAAAARDANAQVLVMDPRPSLVVRHVDGREGAPEEAVKIDGIIVYDYSRLDRIAAFALQTLFDHSPFKSGLYRDSHTLLLNGEPVSGNKLVAWRPSDEAAIVNFTDYARVIEVGGMKMRVPGTDHVYQVSQQIVAAEHPEALVKFTYRNIEGGRIVGRRAKHGVTRYPALIIRER
jgi:hypothetical protein